MQKISFVFIITACLPFFSSCSKLLEVSPPISSITTEEIFDNDKQADWAIAGVYTNMINATRLDVESVAGVANTLYSAGLSTLQGGLSSDELTSSTDLSNSDYFSQRNKLTLTNSVQCNEIWYSAYRTIFNANAVIDGIAASTAKSLSDSARKQLTGEALSIRAFSYFYLVNYYGELPLVLSSDFKKTFNLSRSPVSKVYEQIRADLLQARSLLTSDFSAGKNERVRINKWFAEAMLARVYLYMKDYEAAINSATAVINHTALFSLEEDINSCFLPNSKEALLQLSCSAAYMIGNAMPEGYLFNRKMVNGEQFLYQLSGNLLAAFEPNDKRRTDWTASSGMSVAPAKYSNGSIVQYYTVLRLAELYLIRAEATMLQTPSAKNNAIADLNHLRRRAGVGELDEQLTADQVLEAVAHERRVELFAEWGHRWFDLKRTGKAREVLSAISYKQPWAGDYQLLYPIPEPEIKTNANLQQNPEYNFR